MKLNEVIDRLHYFETELKRNDVRVVGSDPRNLKTLEIEDIYLDTDDKGEQVLMVQHSGIDMEG